MRSLLATSQAKEAEQIERCFYFIFAKVLYLCFAYRLNLCERAVVDLTRECESAHMHSERLQAELKDVEAEAIKSSKATSKSSNEPPNSSYNESVNKAAHTWWQYVWHECSRLGVERSTTLQMLHRGNGPIYEASDAHHDQAYSGNALNNLRNQAIEIATLKQV